MATCYNKNTAEYKALLNKFKNRNLVVDSVINKWQQGSQSDLIPTLVREGKVFEGLPPESKLKVEREIVLKDINTIEERRTLSNEQIKIIYK